MSMKCAKCGKPTSDARTIPPICFGCAHAAAGKKKECAAARKCEKCGKASTNQSYESPRCANCASGKKKECSLTKVAKAPSVGEIGAVLGGTIGGYTLGHEAQAVLARQFHNAAKKAINAGDADAWWARKKLGKQIDRSNVGTLLGAGLGGAGALHGVASARRQARSESVRRALATALGVGGVGAVAANLAMTNSIRNNQKRKHAGMSSENVRAALAGTGGGAIGGTIGALLTGAKGPAEVARMAAMTGAASGATTMAGNAVHDATVRAKRVKLLKRVGLGAAGVGAAAGAGTYLYRRRQGQMEKQAGFPGLGSIWEGVARSGLFAGAGGFLSGAAHRAMEVAKASAPGAVPEAALALRKGISEAKPVVRAARGEVKAAIAAPAQRQGRAFALQDRALASEKAASELEAGMTPERLKVIRQQAETDHATARAAAATDRAARTTRGGALSPTAAAAAQAEQADIKAGTRVAPAPKFSDASEQKLYDLHRKGMRDMSRAGRLDKNTGDLWERAKQTGRTWIPGPKPPGVAEKTRGVIQAQQGKARAALSPLAGARADLKAAQEMDTLRASQPGGVLPTLSKNPMEFLKMHGGSMVERGLKVGIPAAAGAAALHTGANAWGKQQLMNTAKKWALPVGAGIGAYALLKD